MEIVGGLGGDFFEVEGGDFFGVDMGDVGFVLEFFCDV